jgi:hypothetical protein
MARKISLPALQFTVLRFYLCGVPGDQLLQNLPRAEMQQGYVVVAVCPAYFFNEINVINVVNVFDIRLGAPH